MNRGRLRVVSCDLDEANAFVKQHHRHHGWLPCHKFSIAVADEAGLIRGVAYVEALVAEGSCWFAMDILCVSLTPTGRAELLGGKP